ncbi:hypothetical protein QBC39DRAFT_119127 [Podospora conica]|nr:hypothetical protein QBC39DRAFT_119127 [Schizothecium conicum]
MLSRAQAEDAPSPVSPAGIWGPLQRLSDAEFHMADMRLVAASRGDWTVGRLVDGELGPDRSSRFGERKRCCRMATEGETEGIQVVHRSMLAAGWATPRCKRQVASTRDQSTEKVKQVVQTRSLGTCRQRQCQLLKANSRGQVCPGWLGGGRLAAGPGPPSCAARARMLGCDGDGGGRGARRHEDEGCVFGDRWVGKGGVSVRPEPPPSLCVCLFGVSISS